jgi:hypothetical protein
MFWRKKAVGKPRGRWENAVRRDDIRKWKATERERQGWRKEIGEAMARKLTEVPKKKKKKKKKKKEKKKMMMMSLLLLGVTES